MVRGKSFNKPNIKTFNQLFITEDTGKLTSKAKVDQLANIEKEQAVEQMR